MQTGGLNLKNLFDTSRAQVGPMTESQSKLFVSLMFAEKAPENAALNSMTVDELLAFAKQEGAMDVFVFAVFAQRLKAAKIENVRYSYFTVLFLASLCTTPGEAVLWAWSLFRATAKADKAIKVYDLADSFPMGFPTEEAIHEAWDAQKGEPGSGIDNRLDREEAWA